MHEQDSQASNREAASRDIATGYVAVAANLVLIVPVAITFGWQDGVRWRYFVAFVLGQVFTIFLYLVLPSLRATRVFDVANDARDVLRSHVRIRERSPRHDAIADEAVQRSGRFARYATSLWLAGAVNLAVVGYLVHGTGGPVKSPYAPLPFAFILNAQLLVSVPIVDLVPDARGIAHFALRAIWIFRNSLLVAVLFYGGSLVAWSHWPVQSLQDAPAAEVLFITGFSVFITTVVNLFTRAAEDEALSEEAQ